MRQRIKGIVHNAFYTREERKENVKCLLGIEHGTNVDMYDYEIGEEGELKVIYKNKVRGTESD